MDSSHSEPQDGGGTAPYHSVPNPGQKNPRTPRSARGFPKSKEAEPAGSGLLRLFLLLVGRLLLLLALLLGGLLGLRGIAASRLLGASNRGADRGERERSDEAQQDLL